VFTKIVESTQPLVAELGVELDGVGVSVPGVVRRADGLVHNAPNLHWTDVPLGQWLRHALRLPVSVANDAELGALAEHLRGIARDAADLVYLSADVGVGGGVISGGTVLRGTGGYVGEFGHMVVRPGGRPCYCGTRGCWETEVGEHALARALGMPEDSARGSIVAELRSLPTPVVLQRLSEFTEWLTIGITNLVNLLGPELVVLGDLFTALPQPVVDALTTEVTQRSLVSRAIGTTRIVVSPLGADAKLIGAAELAFEPVLAAG
jgi:predicted NBD/HSP70 family sugar kinase